MTPYIAFGGVKWSRNDVDGPNAGRSMSGLMIRDRISTKIRLDITCTPLKAEQVRKVLNAIQPEYVTVSYDDPMYGYRSARMYSNNNPATYCMMNPDGTEYWDGIEFPLIEQ